jgi:hypothetical protein
MTYAIVIISFAVILPLALTRTVSALWFGTVLSAGFVAVLCIALLIDCATAPIADTVTSSASASLNYFRGLAITVNLFSNHTLSFVALAVDPVWLLEVWHTS